MTKRLIVHIDEEKCDGCGLCVPSCAEGAIQVRDGKARLVSETYCDGLGACLAECPRGAITIVEREAEPFDEGTVPNFVSAKMRLSPSPPSGSPAWCETPVAAEGEQPSALQQWPIQLRLVPPDAPFLADADVLLVADCVPFALADFHRRFLQGRPVLIGCPKLDDQSFYVGKLTEMLARSSIRSLTVIHMEVPCCTGLVRIAEAALEASGKKIPLEDVVVSIRGKILGRQTS